MEGFVQDGRALVCTGNTSLINEQGKARDNFGLANVIGADYVGLLDHSLTFIQPTGHPVCNGIDKREKIPLRSHQIKIKPRKKTQIIANQLLPVTYNNEVRSFAFGKADVPAGKPNGYPAITTNKFGKGRCVYITGDVTGAYGKYGYPSLRKLFLNAIDFCVEGKKPIEVEGPLSLEVNCLRQKNRLLIHFLNYTTGSLRLYNNIGGPMAEETIPCRNIPVKLKVEKAIIKKVYLAGSKQDIPFEKKNSYISFVVPRVEIHEIVVVEY